MGVTASKNEFKLHNSFMTYDEVLDAPQFLQTKAATGHAALAKQQEQANQATGDKPTVLDDEIPF